MKYLLIILVVVLKFTPVFAQQVHTIKCTWCPENYNCWECMPEFTEGKGCLSLGISGGSTDPELCPPGSPKGGCIMHLQNMRTGNYVSIYHPPNPDEQVCTIIPPLPGSIQDFRLKLLDRALNGPQPTPTESPLCGSCICP